MVSVFDIVKYFNRNENWGDPDKVKPELIMLLDYLRYGIASPIHINNSFASSGHAPKSYHYIGMAVDFTIPKMDLKTASNRINIWLNDCGLSNKVGLGIYPYPQWNTPGFHLDIRGHKARWGRVNGVYVSYESALKSI